MESNQQNLIRLLKKIVHRRANNKKYLAYYQKGPTVNVDFNNFIEAVNSFDEIKSSRMKLADADKNQMEFKSKLSHKESEEKNQTNRRMK